MDIIEQENIKHEERNSLPEALKYFKPPFHYENEGQTIYCQSKNGDNMCLQIRGWGNLIGGGAENLPPKDAAKIQDDFAEWVVKCLNKESKYAE